MGEGQVRPSHYRITSMRKETMPLWGIEFKPEQDGGEADSSGGCTFAGSIPPTPIPCQMDPGQPWRAIWGQREPVSRECEGGEVFR